jgi:hypothetical protein
VLQGIHVRTATNQEDVSSTSRAAAIPTRTNNEPSLGSGEQIFCFFLQLEAFYMLIQSCGSGAGCTKHLKCNVIINIVRATSHKVSVRSATITAWKN